MGCGVSRHGGIGRLVPVIVHRGQRVLSDGGS
jgi:hypothetical protein